MRKKQEQALLGVELVWQVMRKMECFLWKSSKLRGAAASEMVFAWKVPAFDKRPMSLAFAFSPVVQHEPIQEGFWWWNKLTYFTNDLKGSALIYSQNGEELCIVVWLSVFYLIVIYLFEFGRGILFVLYLIMDFTAMILYILCKSLKKQTIKMFPCNTKLLRPIVCYSKWQSDFQTWTMPRFPGPWHPSSPRQTQHSTSSLVPLLAQFPKETKPSKHDLYLSLSSFLSTPEPQSSIFPVDSVKTGGKVFTEPFKKTAFSASTKKRGQKTLVFPIAFQPLENQAVSARLQI